MSDEIEKIDADKNSDTEKKSEEVKKTAASKKKVNVKKTDNLEDDGKKKNIVDKLQAMGIMSGRKTDATESTHSETEGYFKITVAVAVAIGVVGSFVWALNKEATNEQVASSENNQVTSSGSPGAWQPSVNSQSKYPGYYRAFDYEKQHQRVEQQQEQQKKWKQQQQQAQEQQRTQQQKWAQQWQKSQQQQRAQQQKWLQQRQQAQQQQRVQQQKWAQQWQQSQEQQRAQQLKWAQQQPYSPRVGYQGQPVPSNYNNAPRYQQPSPYYRSQY